MIKRNANGKIVPKRFSFERLQTAADENEGFCLACGHRAHGVEPDARNYKCEACDKPYVFGAEELVLMGAVKY